MRQRTIMNAIRFDDPPTAPDIPHTDTTQAVNAALHEVLGQVNNLRKEQASQVVQLDQLTRQVNNVLILTSAEKVFRTTATETGTKPSVSQQPPESPHQAPVESEGTLTEFLKQHRNLAHLFEQPEDDAKIYQMYARRIVENRWFERVIGIVIIVNSIMLGIETERRMNGIPPGWPDDIEYVFIGLYTVEILLRFVSYGMRSFCDGWFMFDGSLVFIAVLSRALQEATESLNAEEQLKGGIMEQILVIRILRVLRFVRALRVIKQFKTIWKLVRGLICSFDVMASTFFLIMMTLYVFACLGMELIGADEDLKANPASSTLATESFGSCWQSIMTLMQFVTLDSINAIYVPLVTVKPILGIYFMALVLAIGIALMNLVTASIVDASLQHSENDRQEQKELLKVEILKSLPQLIQTFHELDKDKSGHVSLQEVEDLSIDMLPRIIQDNISVDRMSDLFEMLDVDGGGELSMEEFIGGILQIWLMDVPLTTIQILKYVRLNKERLLDATNMILSRIAELEAHFNAHYALDLKM